ncbi:cell envelope-related function transcriptional attenuator common domain-containing protein [Amycolatopsis arida]|uniref:Cell envelope-related function transcriptional attenuator common domain-containing protein n=1 Tax=Amycolatopsis arida TaxID=587909 RepID=A0A1I5XDJ2_9PSEU|nr:LCP family protein [Amycolatopsis arida]TDX97513.1 LCP family protein required for cell wall assembly [Amycolatopsis arida]SFQ30049.1 cell envelope-related function transcriptional attenuator common domain-containing protein [Amycolatopsis arida]
MADAPQSDGGSPAAQPPAARFPAAESAVVACRRWGTLAARTGVAVLAVAVLAGVGYLWHLRETAAGGLHTLPDDAFAGLPDRPAPASPAADGSTPVTLLLLGSDRRVGEDAGREDVTGERADAIMLVHLSAARDRVDVLSLPRDSWVDIPGRGTAKINASLAFGGVPLAVRTVESVTGVRVDHAMAIDFTGVRNLTTALGGVTVDNDRASTDPLTGEHFAAGPIPLAGERALVFLRQRYGLPEGDLDRIVRQQMLLGAIGSTLADARLTTDPARLREVVRIVAGNLTVDAGLSVDRLSTLLVEVLGVPEENIRFHTAPVAGFGRSADGQSSVLLDIAGLAEAAAAIRADRPLPLTAAPVRF